jgi:hypothetical protein
MDSLSVDLIIAAVVVAVFMIALSGRKISSFTIGLGGRKIDSPTCLGLSTWDPSPSFLICFGVGPITRRRIGRTRLIGEATA